MALTGIQRFWIGGGGALLPLLITLIGADLAVLIDQHDQLTTGMVIGAGIRYACLFILGGTVAALNSDENKPLKLVQLGIAAPALITSYISVGPVNANITQAFRMPAIVSSAFAGEPASDHGPRAGEIVVASGIFSDILKGWSQPLNRAVKRAPSKPPKPKTKRTANADGPASSPAAAKPLSPAQLKQKEALLKKKMKIEQELKRLENQR